MYFSSKGGYMEKYDIALSIGKDCRPAFYLGHLGLRKFASPMDWQVCNIKNQIELYKNHFKSFFDEYVEDDTIERDRNFRAVRDKKNNILSMHHIDSNLPLDKAVEQFKELMKKRYERLDHKLSLAQSILLVSNEQVSLSNLKKYVFEFSKIYPNKQITLINIEDIPDDKFYKKTYHLSENICIVKYFFDDTFNVQNSNDIEKSNFNWIGNKEKWIQLISEYGLNE